MVRGDHTVRIHLCARRQSRAANARAGYRTGGTAMISLKDYTAYDGLGLAELVARKEVTADELATAAFEAVKKVNPKINAVLQTLPAEAAAEIRAGLPRGPFTGVPFMIKELVLH